MELITAEEMIKQDRAAKASKKLERVIIWSAILAIKAYVIYTFEYTQLNQMIICVAYIGTLFYCSVNQSNE